MAGLRGDVAIFGFPDLLQHLANNQHAGVLTIVQGPMKKVIYMSPDGMRLLATSTRKTSSLGEILIRTRKITRIQLDRLLQEQQKTGKRLGELVSRQGMVNKQDIETALREQAREEIFDLFSWLDATFEFVQSPPPPRPPDFPLSEVVVDASPTSIMLEAARRADELAVIMREIRDESMIPIRTRKPFSPEGHGLHPDLVSAVYSQVNGRVGISEVIRLSLYPRFEALRAMYVLSKREFVKILDREGATMVHLRADTTKIRVPQTGPAKPAPAKGGARRPILLLGDMLKYRQALAALLRDAGYEVLEYAAAQAMTLLAEKRRIDAVILDVGLSNADEFQFLGWLCENTRSPVIVLSSDASKETALVAVQRGARAYLVKPFTRESVLRTLGSLLQSTSATLPPAKPPASPQAK